MKALLVALIVFICTSFASATVTWTCVKDFQTIAQGYYEVVGTCTPSGTYTAGAGGDALGSAATATATAAAVCHSSAQTLVDLMISVSADGAVTTNGLLAFDHTNFKVMCYGGAASGVVLAECATASAVRPFRFRAVCK